VSKNSKNKLPLHASNTRDELAAVSGYSQGIKSEKYFLKFKFTAGKWVMRKTIRLPA
jgi:hypothetical protein